MPGVSASLWKSSIMTRKSKEIQAFFLDLLGALALPGLAAFG
jgi:hypothetical protein